MPPYNNYNPMEFRLILAPPNCKGFLADCCASPCSPRNNRFKISRVSSVCLAGSLAVGGDQNQCSLKNAAAGALVTWTPMKGVALVTGIQGPLARLVVICKVKLVPEIG